MNVTIRPAVENDYPAIVEMFKEFAHFEHLDDRLTNTVERMKAEAEYFNCFVAVNNEDNIVGYATYFFSYFTWTGKSLYMDDLYVKEIHRGAGIGKLLINKVIAFAKSAGCHKLRWQVSDWNAPAIGFYKGLGAEIDNQERNCDLDF
ncbi:MAG TPA: GNAT family N-acetyltransferase [Prolixibacteraceae bacterium]|jgi:GNAT superfamily N-acetyltransferase